MNGEWRMENFTLFNFLYQNGVKDFPKISNCIAKLYF